MDYNLINTEVLRNFLTELGISDFKLAKGVLIDGTHKVEIKEIKRKRSLNQNALWWKWIGIIAKEIGYESEHLANEIKLRTFDPVQAFYNGKIYLIPKSSSKLSTKDFGKLMDATELMARHLNITLPYPEHYGYERNN